MTSIRALHAACVTAAASTLFGLAAPAAADVIANSYVNSQVYDYRITYMTDIDQKRTGLRSNGAMFCVPTSCLNLFAYAANHGFPVGGLPPANYMSNAQHGYMTTWIDFIGDLMQTDGQDGTSCCVSSSYQALVNGSVLKRKIKYMTSEFTPGQASMTQIACNGWIVSFTYGRYEQDGTAQGYPIYSRHGGHAVTLVRSTRQGESRVIKYRDPNNDSSLTTQSDYANKVYNPSTVTGFIGNAGLRTVTRLFSSDGNPRFIDALHCIRPMYYMNFVNTGDSLGGGTIGIVDPFPFEGSEGAMVPDVAVSPFLTVQDVNLHPDGTSGLVIAKSIFVGTLSRLRTLDLQTGVMTILDPSPAGLVKMDWSGKSRIFTFDTLGKLYQLNAEGEIVHATSAVPQPAAIAVDDQDDALWVLSVAERKLVKVTQDFSETLVSYIIPTNVPMSGDAEIVIDPVGGLPWFHTDATNTVYGVGQSGTGAPVMIPVSLGTVDSMSISDDRLYITANGQLKVFQPLLTTAGWAPDTNSPFNGLPGGSRIAMLRNSDNYDPNIHSGPEWVNLTTAEIGDTTVDVPDCLGDQNDDGIVDASDLSLLLGAWGTSGDTGDINQDNVVNAADLAALLGAWGNCPS